VFGENVSSKTTSTRDFEKISINEAFNLLSSKPSGLSDEEAEMRLSIYGPNVIEEKRESTVLEFLKRFWGPMPWLLEIAILLSLIIGRVIETTIITSLLVINAIIGFLHHESSRKVLEMLRSKLAPKAKVLRSGVLRDVEARLIVPGDIIVVELGDVVPADCKIIEGEVLVDQSLLTGESLPVEVTRGGVLFAGSIIKRGRARCLVVNTGKNTYFGKTIELVKIARPRSHTEEIMLAITKYSMYVGVLVMIFADIYILLSGLKNEFISILTFDLAILMGCVPVALPAVLTIMQAVGARELAERGVLVTRLDAVEDAASVDILCLDKTGTITMGSLEVSEITPISVHSEKEVIELALYASPEDSDSPVDIAINRKARELGVVRRGKQVSFTPFDPSIKRSESVVELEGRKIRVVLGAPQVIIGLSGGGSGSIEEVLERYAERGLRTLLVAYGEEGGSMTIAGVIGLSDPPRPDSQELISELRKLGVKPLMITGDTFLIAREIARRVGIGDKGYSLSHIREKLSEVLEEVDYIAEVYPEDKHAVVKALQDKGHMVGMTGDGVNDAPALRRAELGIAVSGAVDVAKRSAGVVLLTPGLRGIVDVIDVSRRVYQRALTWILNKVAKVIQFTLLLPLGLILLHYDVLSLMGMVLLVFANDFATISLSTDNAEPSLSPRKWDIKRLVISSSIIGVALLLEALLAIYIGLSVFHLDMSKMQTFILLNMVFTSQFRVLILRERRWFWSSKPSKMLTTAIVGVIMVFTGMGIAGVILEPIPISVALFILVYSAVFTLSIDPIKVLVFRKAGLLG
jgi:H+-transporting ATPase